MNFSIQLSKDLILNERAITETFAWLGRKGSGKTYGASKMAEEMLKNGVQCVILDTVGTWYGLRLKSDGRTPSALNLPIFGGLHGHSAPPREL